MQHTRRLHRRAAGFLGYNVHLGSRLPMRGAVLMTAFGWLALVPLVLRVVFPWLSSRWRRIHQTPFSARRTRLQLDRTDDAPPIGRYSGFTVREMADIVRRVIEESAFAIASRRSCSSSDTDRSASTTPRIGARLWRVRRRPGRAQRPRIRADGQRSARAAAACRRGAVDRRDHVVRWRAAQHLQ